MSGQKNLSENRGHSRFLALRLAIRNADSEISSRLGELKTDNHTELMSIRRLFRENGADPEQVDIYTRVEAAMHSGDDYLKKKNFLMATISFKDAYLLESDEELKKRWLNKLINAHVDAIRTYTRQGKPERAASFGERLSRLLKSIADNEEMSTSDSFT